MLFGALNPNIFMLFAGENRFLYEEVLTRIYEDCFGADLLFPTQNELVGIIYDILASRPDLWHDEGHLVSIDEVSTKGRRLRPRNRPDRDRDATTDAMARARHIYARLLDTGWLDESRYGLRVTVDMPAGAMRLAEFLSTLKEGATEQLGGLVVEVKNALEGVKASASQNALGLHKAAKDAVGFGRYLRSVLSSLQEIDRQVIASESLNERLQHYFEEFVERILLKDFAAISTIAHPYRFRYAILDALQVLEDSPVDVDSLASAYADAHLAADAQVARDLVFDDLHKIRRVFGRIDEAFMRIQQHRSRLEIRLRNTVRYAGRRADAYLRRSEHLVLQIDRLIAHSSATGKPKTTPGHLEAVKHPFSASLLARPRGERAHVIPQLMMVPEIEPINLLRRELERAYLARITILPAQVLDFLNARIRPSDAMEAKHLPIESLDDFLVFETLRRSMRNLIPVADADAKAIAASDDAVSRRLRNLYEFSLLPDGSVDNDWVTCDNFVIRRRQDARTARENQHAV